MTVQIVTIASDQLSADISTMGAELQHLADAERRQLLWDGDPAFWSGRAPILFPVVGALSNGEYRLDDNTFAMPRHGFARRSMFEIVECSSAAATFRLCSSDKTRIAYPFEFVLDIAFLIEDAALSISASITNLGDGPMPVSIGFHPAFCWPLPYGEPREDHDIRFEAEEPAPVRRIGEDGLLIADPEPTPVVGNRLALHDDLFVADAVIFDRLVSRRVTYGGKIGPRITVDFSDLPSLGVWTKPGAGFICIEPWQGMADPLGFSGDIFEKPGIISIAPGESRPFVMTLSLSR